MDTNLKTSSAKKLSLLKRIVQFAQSDENYQPEAVREVPIVTRMDSKKTIFAWINVRAAMIVLGTFYILLCAFILMNPQYALFFNNAFGIEYVTVQFILQYTIYVFYSIFGIGIGILFLFFWFRSVVIKTHKKQKRIALWGMTVVLGGLFFGNMLLFAMTYAWFESIDFTNLDERVIVYDNTLLGYKPVMSDKKLDFFKAPQKAIGPLSVRYDIRPQIKKIVRENGFLLNRGYSFEIDYNGDGDPDTGSGDNINIDLPMTDPNAPVFVPGKFEEAGQYKTTAKLRGIDAAGNKKEVIVEIPDILVQNVVKVSDKVMQDGSRTYIFDASDLVNLGQAHWSILDTAEPEYTGYQFSPKSITKYPAIVCLKMQPMDIGTTDPCDWRYVIGENIQTNITNTAISFKVDPLNPLKYEFSLEPTLGQGEIKKIRWNIDGKPYDGKFTSGTEKILDYTFKTSGTYVVEAEIEDTLGNTVSTATEPLFTTLFTELKSGYTLRIIGDDGSDKAKNTYNTALKTYFLADQAVPTVVTLDAIGIQSTNPRLKLTKAEWDINNDGVYEKEGFKISQELALPEQYTLYARYTFEDKTINGEIKPQIYIDKIVVKGVEKPLDVRVKILPDHDYAPALVHFDATGSRVQKGEILKFIYDFGDGGKVYEGEGIVDYRYKTPGEYTVRVTAVTKDGQKATKESILIIKKPQESITVVPSVSSENAQAGFPITFDITAQGAVESVVWNFGDNTVAEEGMSVVHTFRTPGTYSITARALYESGIEKAETIIYQVK